MKNKNIFLAITFLLLAAFVQSCKKGCTDPAAYNYTQGAKYDNATCLYCDSNVSVTYAGSDNVIDQNSSSTHFNQYVLGLEVLNKQVLYSGNGCQKLGVGITGNNGCLNATFLVVLSNQIGNTLIVSGNLLTTSQSNSINTPISSFSIPPYSSDTVNIGQICEINNFGADITLESASFQYH